jgi:hypothetical protein
MQAYCLTRQKPNTGLIQPVRRQCAGLQRLFCPTLLPLIPIAGFSNAPTFSVAGAGLLADDEVNYRNPFAGNPIRKTLDGLLRLCRRSTTSLGEKAANSPTQKIHCKDQSSDRGYVSCVKAAKFPSHATRSHCHHPLGSGRLKSTEKTVWVRPCLVGQS